MSSDPLLHIKDGYYFDVPRAFWKADYENAAEMSDEVGEWVVRNDADFQDYEADDFIVALRQYLGKEPALDHAKAAWKEWQHSDPHHHGRPFDQWVEDSLKEADAKAAEWIANKEVEAANATTAYLAEEGDDQLNWMHSLRLNEKLNKRWNNLRSDMDSSSRVEDYLDLDRAEWPAGKIKEINYHLSGKVFIPQPFATLKNAYEVQSGFGITRYMCIEVAVAIIIFLTFRWVAGRVSTGEAPRGKLWNLLESFLTFIKTDVVEKGIDAHDSPKFMPLMWTIFFFILGCNLMGMVPWVGSPTASFGVTVILALIVFLVGTYLGIQKFGLIGYLKNLCPEMGLPAPLAIFIVPMVWAIELFSLFIKHGILAVRLLMNMAAGHLVLLGIMGLAFSVSNYAMSSGGWAALSVVSILGTTILSFLELFVAFLQAYVFTLLASQFIGSATHHH